MSKGDWVRHRDDKKYEEGYKKSFGKECKLNHKHDENCQTKKKETNS